MRLFFDGSNVYGRRVLTKENAAIILRQDPLHCAERLISRHELHIWFEPDWHLARRLAARFPHCFIYSIPVESNTASLHRVPGWRTRRTDSAFL